MQKFDDINDQMLEAFVDGQLDPAHCELVLEAMNGEQEIRGRVEALRRAKDLVKLAYQDATPPTRVESALDERSIRLSTFGIAASVLVLVAGSLAGLVGYSLGTQQSAVSALSLAAETQEQKTQLILHISESNPEHFAAALVYTRAFLDKHDPQDGQIEVVANAGGLDLLRSGVSPFEEQINAMIRDYKNVHFYACANAIKALRNKGIEPVLIDNVDTGLPAFDRIVNLLQKGWTYKKVRSLLET